MGNGADRVWAGLCCPSLPLAAVWHLVPDAALDDRPAAVHDRVRGQARILQANRPARRGGVRPGQTLAGALAILPALESRPRSPGAEQAALERMALAAYGHSHQVVLAPPDTVLLEIAGSRRLRGGLKPLLQALARELEDQGFPVRLGSAPVAAAARLLARTGRHAPTPAALEAVLSDWPLDVLELEPGWLEALTGCGLERAGQLLRLPAAERARRFGPELNRHLDRLRGRIPTPLAGWQPAETFRLALELPVASAEHTALLFALNRGLDDLGAWLRVRDRALVRLKLRLEPEDGGAPARLEAGLARPGFDRARLLELVRLKLEPLRLPGPVERIALAAETTGEHRPPQADLWDGANRGDAWPALLDRLAARLGEDAVCGLATCPDHRPERAWRWTRPGSPAGEPGRRPRPGWLLPEPRPCRVEDLVLDQGPERIESGWWDGGDCRRDYWSARDRHGRRIWVFREYKPRSGWFIHGLFG